LAPGKLVLRVVRSLAYAFSLTDSEKDRVLQIHDITPDQNWLNQTEQDTLTLDHFVWSATSMKVHDAKQ